MTQKYKCATCGGQLVLTMGLNGTNDVGMFNDVMKEAKEYQKAGKYEFRHITGDCKNIKPELTKKKR